MRATLMVGTLLATLSGAAAQDAPKRDCGPLPSTIEGEAAAIDGDTLAMLHGDTRVANVRLWGIQAPELRNRQTGIETPAGMTARLALQLELAFSTNCRPIEWDRHCRIIATCSNGEVDLGEIMLRKGMAYLFSTYAVRADMREHLQRYRTAERGAMIGPYGLWRQWRLH